MSFDYANARAEAIAIVRRKLDKGHSRESIIGTTYEGACGPAMPGYLLQAGKLSVPYRLDGPTHTFRVTELLREIDTPQADLFGAAA